MLLSQDLRSFGKINVKIFDPANEYSTGTDIAPIFL